MKKNPKNVKSKVWILADKSFLLKVKQNENKKQKQDVISSKHGLMYQFVMLHYQVIIVILLTVMSFMY